MHSNKTKPMKQDLQIFNLIKKEEDRQTSGLELIASENYVSQQVLEALGSICTNKYAEGYPGARYYGGCEVVDQIEQLAIDRLCEIYEAEYANVQPHSGAQANMAVMMSVRRFSRARSRTRAIRRVLKPYGSVGVSSRSTARSMALLRFILYEYIKFLSYAVQTHLNVTLALRHYLCALGNRPLFVIEESY